jgi:hypothetical protein
MFSHHGFRSVVLLTLAASALAAHAAHAQLSIIRPQQRLQMPPQNAPRPTLGTTTFGEFALTDGQTIVVTVGQGPAAYAYTKDSTGRWVYDSALVAPEGITAIGGAVRGNVAVLQGLAADFIANVVFVFVRSGGQWAHTQTLPGTSFVSRANRLALGPNYLAIGDIEANNFAGVVHIYNQVSPGHYAFDSDLSAAGSDQGFLLGYHVIADGDTVLAASPGNAMVSAFARSSGVWSEQARLIPDDFMFAWFFAVSGNRAFLAPAGNPQQFVRRDGTWLKRDVLNHPSDPQRHLMNPIAMDGRRLIVGEEGSEDALLFELHDGNWTATAVLRNANDQSCPRIVDSGPISLVGRLALAACPTVPTPHHVFDGRVLVYELPPLQQSSGVE